MSHLKWKNKQTLIKNKNETKGECQLLSHKKALEMIQGSKSICWASDALRCSENTINAWEMLNKCSAYASNAQEMPKTLMAMLIIAHE